MAKNASTLSNLEYKNIERLNYFDINENEVLSITKNINASKAHGWYKMLIRIIKRCGKTIAFPLKLMFRSMLEEDVFPQDWGKKPM